MLVERNDQRIVRRARQTVQAAQHLERFVIAGDLAIGNRAVRLRPRPCIEKAGRQVVVALAQRLLQPIRPERAKHADGKMFEIERPLEALTLDRDGSCAPCLQPVPAIAAIIT